mmetsp:Transcript_9255/g.28759  ORF Transcript_9255/g.28759 Transcript_9255/m.28759 type:complete len:243 (-) Transcript_9255:582-1310(-)
MKRAVEPPTGVSAAGARWPRALESRRPPRSRARTGRPARPRTWRGGRRAQGLPPQGVPRSRPTRRSAAAGGSPASSAPSSGRRGRRIRTLTLRRRRTPARPGTREPGGRANRPARAPSEPRRKAQRRGASGPGEAAGRHRPAVQRPGALLARPGPRAPPRCQAARGVSAKPKAAGDQGSFRAGPGTRSTPRRSACTPRCPRSTSAPPALPRDRSAPLRRCGPTSGRTAYEFSKWASTPRSAS